MVNGKCAEKGHRSQMERNWKVVEGKFQWQKVKGQPADSRVSAQYIVIVLKCNCTPEIILLYKWYHPFYFITYSCVQLYLPLLWNTEP
jgi:hypothetical protein